MSERFASRLIRRAVAILVAEPNCLVCGKGKAQTFWMADPMGGIQGMCDHCAEMRHAGSPASTHSKEDSNGRLR